MQNHFGRRCLVMTKMINDVREDAQRVIADVPVLAWGQGNECTFVGALQAAMAVTPHPHTYTDMMGWSGLAFRTRWWKPKDGSIGACCSCAVGEMEEATETIARATGWTLRVEFHSGQDTASCVGQIVESIDAGKPVVAYDDRLDMAVVYGYREGGRILLFRDYHCGEDEHALPASKLGFLWFLPGEHQERITEREKLVDALRIAVRNWRRGTGHEGPGDYWYGKTAYDAWRRTLQKFEKLNESTREKVLLANRFSFVTLLDARRSAVRFLLKHLELLRGAGADGALRDAAETLQHEVSLLEEERREWQKDATDERVRARQREVLFAARIIENAAEFQIEDALQLCGERR